MNINEVIKYPILSEKSYKQMEENVYTFAVHPKTNRAEVKKAVELIFEVKVAKVNIVNIAKKPTKLGKSEGFTNAIKKAIIKLSEGKINIFPDEVESVEDTYKEELKKEEKPKQIVITDAEKKAAAKIAAKTKEKIETIKEQSQIKPEEKLDIKQSIEIKKEEDKQPIEIKKEEDKQPIEIKKEEDKQAV